MNGVSVLLLLVVIFLPIILIPSELTTIWCVPSGFHGHFWLRILNQNLKKSYSFKNVRKKLSVLKVNKLYYLVISIKEDGNIQMYTFSENIIARTTIVSPNTRIPSRT